MRHIQRLRDGGAVPDDLRGGVVAIGNFDGVHRGHQSVLRRALDEGEKLSAPVVGLTFEPHPRTVFKPDAPLFILTPPPLKARLMGALGFDAVMEVPFTREFAALSAEAFVTEILCARLAIRHAVTGFDFHFGKGREGGPAFLLASGERHGFGVSLLDAFRDEGGEVVSSSRIRLLLSEGAVEQAAGLLGYRFAVAAPVIAGKQLGRTLGYPTANMALPERTDLKHGIYAVRFRRPNGTVHDGVASFGRRPTVDSEGAPLLETFLFDFSGDLYGETAQVSLFGYLRAEEKFDGLEALVRQMRRDEVEARALLSGAMPLSPLDEAMSFDGSRAV